MATPPSAPPPTPLAGLTPPGPDGPDPMPEGPDQPLMLTTDQLGKLGMTSMQPGQSFIVQARITIGGTPDAPTAEIVAAGDAQPDDGSADLVPLTDDAAPPPGDAGMPVDLGDGASAPPPGGDDDTPPGTVAPGSDAEEKILGFKRPSAAGRKSVSAKDVFGE